MVNTLHWIIGVTLALLATLTSTLSKLLWKLSHNLEAEAKTLKDLEKQEAKRQWSVCVWWLGFLSLCFNVPADIVALALAPQSIVTATAGSATIFNLMLVRAVTGESFNSWDVAGACLVFLGCVGVGLVSMKEHTPWRFDDVAPIFFEPAFVAYTVVWGVLLCVLAFFAVHTKPTTKARALLRKMSHGLLSGTLGGFFVPFTVGVRWMTPGSGAFGHWQTYGVLGFGAFCSLYGAALLNWSLKSYDAVFMSPMNQSLLVLIGGSSAAAFFGLPETTGHVVLFWFSLFIVAAGSTTCLLADGVEVAAVEAGGTVGSEKLQLLHAIKGGGGGEGREGEDEEDHIETL